jgi:adenosylcobinamide-phosphate synthase
MLHMLEHVLIIPLAVIIDLLFGEYPARLHPVVWIGNVISFLLKFAPKRFETLQFIYGVLAVVISIGLFSVPAWFLMEYLRETVPVVFTIVGALLVKSTFSLKALRREALKVKNLLERTKLDDARKQVGYLVSRDTTNLSEGEVASAVIEMVSESITDSIISPLFWWVILGVPGAIGFRVANTWDSRIGYRGEYEYLGKFAARLDDVLNYIPARIGAFLLIIAAFLLRMHGVEAWKAGFRYHRKTSSPNAGWTMAVAAGALQTRLEKPGHYRLGVAEEFPGPDKIPAVIRLVMTAGFFWFFIAAGAVGAYYYLTA